MAKNKFKVFARKVFERTQEVELSDAAAALSYRSLIAIVPAIAILVTVAGAVLGRDKVLVWFFYFFEGILKTDVNILESAVEGTFDRMSGFVFSSVVLIIFVWASVGLVNQVRKTFFHIFNLEIKASGLVGLQIRSRFISLLYTFLVFVLIISVIVLQPILSVTYGLLGSLADGINLPVLLQVFQMLFSIFTVVLIFSLIYWFMSSGTLHLRSIIVGSAFSSGLFFIFNTLLSLYFSYSFTLSLFGASWILIALLVWLYYFAFILFLGGVVANVFDRSYLKKKDKDRVVYI